MDLQAVNDRVDAALRANARAEKILIGMAVALFALGVLACLLAYWAKNLYISSGTILAQVFLNGPIGEIRRLRRENVVLQVTPQMAATLPADKMAGEIMKLLGFLRGGKS